MFELGSEKQAREHCILALFAHLSFLRGLVLVPVLVLVLLQQEQ